MAKVGIDRDRKNPSDEGRNVIAAAIGAEHADYDRLIGAGPAAVPAPPAATPAFVSAGGQPGPAQPAAGNAPFWAR